MKRRERFSSDRRREWLNRAKNSAGVATPLLEPRLRTANPEEIPSGHFVAAPNLGVPSKQPRALGLSHRRAGLPPRGGARNWIMGVAFQGLTT